MRRNAVLVYSRLPWICDHNTAHNGEVLQHLMPTRGSWVVNSCVTLDSRREICVYSLIIFAKVTPFIVSINIKKATASRGEQLSKTRYKCTTSLWMCLLNIVLFSNSIFLVKNEFWLWRIYINYHVHDRLRTKTSISVIRPGAIWWRVSWPQ